MRRFLQHAAALDDAAWAQVRRRHAELAASAGGRQADRALGTAIDRGGLERERDAAVGPIVQLAQRVGAERPEAEEATAEALLGAVLALIAGDLLEGSARDLLLAPFAPAVDLAALDA